MPRDRIIDFYSGGRDARDRTLEEILEWPDERLEEEHDYVQWVFPTRLRSRVNPSAPLVTSNTVKAFASDAGLRARLQRAFVRMLRFYGLRLSTSDGAARNADAPPQRVPPPASGSPVVEIDPDRFDERSAAWLRPFNHNHLRLTRIMQSLDALGLSGEARALQRCLLAEVATGQRARLVAPETLEYWKEAVA